MGVKYWKDIDLNGVKGILWDLDNTIYVYEHVHKLAYAAVKKQATQFGITETDFDIHWKKARQLVHNQLHGQAASHSRILYLQKLYEGVHGYTNPEFALEMEEVYWSNFLNYIEIRNGAIELIKKAGLLGIQMAIVTDLTAQIQLKKMKHLNLNPYVKYLVSSEEAGAEKPEPAIFQLALDKLNLSPSEVIMIGDSYEKDILGANTMGIKSYLIDDDTK